MTTSPEDAARALHEVLVDFGHDDGLSDVTILDGLDMIAAKAEGWPAALAAHLYHKEIKRAAKETEQAWND